MSASEESLSLTATDLRLATLRLARRLRRERAVDEMTDAQLGVLGTLRLHGRRTVSALAEHERVTSPSMTSIVNGLAEQGYVIRVPDAEDRRRVHIELTEKGREVIAQTVRKRDASLAQALGGLDLTEAELSTLREASALMRRLTER